MALYFLAAVISFAFAEKRAAEAPGKLLGMAALVALAVITADWVSRPGVMPAVARVAAGTSLATSVAALAGVGLFLYGYPTRLVGTYGDLLPGAYARAQAGLSHPNMLASYCLFAAAIVAHPEARLPARLRRAALLGLWLGVLLTFSRGILAFVLSALVRRASGPAGRKVATAYAVAAAGVLAALTLWKVSVNPTEPHRIRIDSPPSSRLAQATSAWESLRARPLLGVGPGNSPGSWRGRPYDAHLTLLNVAATLGLPALAAFVAIPVLLWRDRSRPTDLSVWGGLAGVGLDSLASDMEDFRHLWLLFGLAGAGLSQASPERSPAVSRAAPSERRSLDNSAAV
jgi:hypothetical protein